MLKQPSPHLRVRSDTSLMKYGFNVIIRGAVLVHHSKRGFLFSRNASTPSEKSSVRLAEMIPLCSSRS